MSIPPRKRKEARRILGSLIERTRLEEGCLDCRLYRDLQAAGILMLQQLWVDETSFQQHLRSLEFRNLLLVVEMASETPVIRFDRVVTTADISAIKGEMLF